MMKTFNRCCTKNVVFLVLLSASQIIASLAPHALAHDAGTFHFSGNRAMDLILRQVEFGPRSPENVEAKENTLKLIYESLKPYTDSIIVLPFQYRGYKGNNVVAKFSGSTTVPRATLMLGTHWDTRAIADKDPNYFKRDSPILGANDGASGVAVLLELARSLSNNLHEINVDLIFFDLEDLGGIDGLPFSIGARNFVAQNTGYRPTAGVIVDMVCDKNLRIPKEINSLNAAPEIINKIWQSAERQHAEVFIKEIGAAIIDDHIPFLASGIPVVNLIHYPFPSSWHTSKDTMKQCSARSLEQVGRVLLDFVHAF